MNSKPDLRTPAALFGMLFGLGCLLVTAFKEPVIVDRPVDRVVERVVEKTVEAAQNAFDKPPEGLGFGWVNDPDAVSAAVALMPTKIFASTPAGQDQPLPDHVYLWKAYEFIHGRPVPLKDQNPTGSCVGFGTTTAIERSQGSELASRIKTGTGDASEYAEFSEEITYAGSRVEANGGSCPIRKTRDNPHGDGSNGGWAALWATGKTPSKVGGMLPKAKYGAIDLTSYSAARARDWNYKGVPDQLEPECAKYKVADSVRIVRWPDAKKALANGYGIAVCSNIGFQGQRNANGVARPGPEWGHCMCLDGYHITPDGKEYGHIENSWAKTGYHHGPVGWGEPTESGFWAEASVIDKMLAQGDSWAYSGVKGFPRQELDWFTAAPAPRRNAIHKEVCRCEAFWPSLAY